MPRKKAVKLVLELYIPAKLTCPPLDDTRYNFVKWGKQWLEKGILQIINELRAAEVLLSHGETVAVSTIIYYACLFYGL
jgi:hypothetical protein